MNQIDAKHVLKSWPEYFQATLNKVKTFELRQHDRDFREGDWVLLREYRPEIQEYTGRFLACQITYVLAGGPWLQPGYCAFGIKDVWEGVWGSLAQPSKM